MSHSLPQSDHLKHRRDFKRVMTGGVSFKLPNAKLYASAAESENSKIGFIVGKKVGHAPKRNRIRRIWKEAFRLERAGFQTPIDVVAKVFPGYTAPELEKVRASLVDLQQCYVESVSP